MKRAMRLLRLLPALLFVAACAKSIPDAPGVYARVGRDWKALAPVALAALQARTPTDMKAMQAAVWVAGSDEPRVVFVGKLPPGLAVLKREGAGFKAVSAAAAPHESAANVWELRFAGGDAPRGLLLLRHEDGTGEAFVNGGDGPLALALGAALRSEKKFDAAEELLTAALKELPNDGPLMNELALTYAAAGHDLGKAKSLANDAIGSAKDDAERAIYYDTLGEAYAADGDFGKAQESIDRAVSLDLRNPSFHTHMAAIIGRVQEEKPEQVLRDFYAAIARGDFDKAEELSMPFDVSRLDDADQLAATYQKMARGAPFANIELLTTVKHGKLARFRYVLVSQDGGKRTEDLKLEFEKNHWKVSLP
jgi:tetratricopeptide (TPR) repeat protein